MVGGGGRNGGEIIGLRLNRRHHFGMLMADIGVHQLAAEIQIFFAIVIPQHTAQPGLNHQGIQRPLHRPRMKHKFPILLVYQGIIGFLIMGKRHFTHS